MKEEPLLLELNVTVPVGAVCVPGEVSVTVTVQVVALPATIVLGEQVVLVDVDRVVEVSSTVPVLVPCVESPE